MHRQARKWLMVLAVCGLWAAWAGSVPAEDKSGASGQPEQKSLDKKVYDALKMVINTGADLYNRDGDRAGCYRLYQGSLLTLRPLLDHRPELQKAIDTGLSTAEGQLSVGARAYALRKVLGEVRDKLKPAVQGGTSPAADTLWDRLGGEANVRKVVDDLVALSSKDSKVNFDRGGKVKLDAAAVERLKKNLVAYISQATGGPIKYTSKSMKEVHKGMAISNAEFDALAADLKTALKQNGAKEADIDAVLKGVEGTRKDIVERK
jgi:hemoglobin